MNLDNFKKHIEELNKSIDTEIVNDGHTSASKDVANEWLKNLDFKSAIELGAGLAQLLDILANWGKGTLAVTLGNEDVEKHNVLREDMHFTNIPDKSYDLVISRHSLEHSYMPLILLMEMYRISKKYSLVIVPMPREEMINWQNHYSVFDDRTWRQLFKLSHWKVIKFADKKYFGRVVDDFLEYRYLLEKEQ